MSKDSKNIRVLSIYIMLCKGQYVNKKELAHSFDVNERSIQRDIDDIRAFLDEQHVKYGDKREVMYDRIKKEYIMVGDEPTMLSSSEILAVSKILLESRAFPKRELNSILNKVINSCTPLKNKKIVNELISNEKYHYVELNHSEYIQDRLWNIGFDIHDSNLVIINYMRQVAQGELVKHIVEPVSILFSEYYFYLCAYIVKKDDSGRYIHTYNYPTIFRIDRIKYYNRLGQKFRKSYANRFEEGEFRKRVQFMYAGQLERVVFKFYGSNPEAVLDRLPTAVIKEQSDNEYLIESEVYGKGIVMWLLSQGNKIEVIKPKKIREEMRETLFNMLERYES